MNHMDSVAQTGSIAIIILAAGGSRRLGRPKQLLPYKGRTLLRHAAEVAVTSEAIVKMLVLGSEAERMKKEIHDLPLKLIINNHWNEGISTSIRAAVQALPGSVEAALFMLCDQPMVSSGLISRMIDARASPGKPIVACEYAGTVGVPALFSRAYFDELSALEGDTGAKRVITTHIQDVFRVPFPEGSIDIDTPEDYDTSDRF